MPLFITYASYSQSGIKGLVDHPSDRSAVIERLVKQAGGSVLGLYMTTGSHDVVLISDLPDGSDAVALGMAVSATGTLSALETVRAWTPADFKAIAERAGGFSGSYTPPGN